MKVYLGADHRGYKLKEKIKQWLKAWGYQIKDFGPKKYDATDDYPDYAAPVAQAVSKGKGKGILLCGSAHGVDIVANKFRGVRSIIGFNLEVVRQGREHDDANVLSIPADWLKIDTVTKMVKEFIQREFSGEERYKRRLKKISAIEDGRKA